MTATPDAYAEAVSRELAATALYRPTHQRRRAALASQRAALAPVVRRVPFSTSEVARILQADVRTVNRWAADGRLVPVGTGPRGMRLFDPAVINSLATVGAAPP